MNRTIISSLSVKYNDETVCSGHAFFEFDTNESIPTDADCIIACLAQAFAPSIFTNRAIPHIAIANSISNVQWKQSYVDPDRPLTPTSSSVYAPKIAHFGNDDSPFISMLDINEDGIDIAAGETFIPYAHKKVALEIADVSETEYLQTVNDFGFEGYAEFNQTESLYHLIKPFLSNVVSTLDANGYQVASDDGKKITLYGKSVCYPFVQM